MTLNSTPGDRDSQDQERSSNEHECVGSVSFVAVGNEISIMGPEFVSAATYDSLQKDLERHQRSAP
jgi:hypothetical protein